ncbi:PilZ domain-containing protein [Sphingomonas kyungheensis]|uniref:PilZ domain-containing protein n=1 Tax=Sphingomonas kyungheensis TaxID=1069987 RepID=A0ABU8H4D6_9SPHN
MAIPAQIIGDDRGSERFTVGLNATLRDQVTRPHDVMIDDLSLTGFRLSGGPALTVGSEASIGFAGIGIHQARVTRQDGDVYGCEFVTPITPEMLGRALSAEPVAPIAFPTGAGALLDHVPEPFVEPYSGRTKLVIATVAAAAGWAVAAGLYLALS